MYNGLLLSRKKEWNLAICDNMNGPRGYYAKWNKSDTERQILCDFIYMWNLKKQNKWTIIVKQTQSHRYREQKRCLPKGRGLGDEGTRWGRLRGTNLQLQNRWVMGTV